MTKHALEAFTIALDEELSPYGVRVSIVQPGGVRTPMAENARPSTLERFRRSIFPFDEEARQAIDSLTAAPDPEEDARTADEPESESNRKPSDPEIVAVAVIEALFSENPRPRYLVGTRWEGERVLRMLITRLLDADDSPSLGDPVEALVDRLRDQAAERARSRARDPA
jgi:NAD(P)-dependent dehydrogenase (short-subunit alcohol dehydrogenase family)